MSRPGEPFHSVSADLLAPSPFSTKLTIAIIGAILAVALVWSYYASIVEVASGSGRVIPERRVQVVQSLEGGVIRDILVHVGDFVNEGDVITRFDPTSAQSARGEAAAQIAGLDATVKSLKSQVAAVKEAEDAGADTALSVRLVSRTGNGGPDFDAALTASYPEFVKQAREQYSAALRELASTVSVYEQQLEQKKSERAQTETKLTSLAASLSIAKDDEATLLKLQASGAAGRGEVNESRNRRIDLESGWQQTKESLSGIDASIRELRGRIAERTRNFETEAGKQVSEAEVRKQALDSALAALDLRTASTEIRASASGIIKTLKPISIGQVLKPGEDIAEIVPAASRQLIEVKVKPEDIAFVAQGMPAIIKLSAFDYSIFGSVTGIVERVSSDSTVDDRGNIFYVVDVRASADRIERKGVVWPIMVGMVATVDIVTGKKTVFQYLTKPIHRMALSAMHER